MSRAFAHAGPKSGVDRVRKIALAQRTHGKLITGDFAHSDGAVTKKIAPVPKKAPLRSRAGALDLAP
jgi:hypothetical protein